MASKITLKPVGKLHCCQKKLKRKSSSFQPNRDYDRFQGEITPTHIIQDCQKEEQDKKKLNRFHISKRYRQQELVFKFHLIEDPRESQFSYRKYLFMEKLLMILALFSFFVAVINIEIVVTQKRYPDIGYSFSSDVDKIGSLITLCLILTTLMRYVAMNQLEIDQKKFYCIKTGHGIHYEIYRLLKRFENFKYFFIEFFVLLPHSLYFMSEKTIQLQVTYNGQILDHRVNDLLTLFSLCRIYIVMRSIINLTVYSTPRASRLCNQNRAEPSFIFTVKCLLKEEPVKIITLVFFINTLALGFGLRLSEGSFSINELNISPAPATRFQNYINCYWCIFITMATVGYGDYYPITLPGRIVGLFSALSGIILSSLLIVSLSAYLTMQANQAKSHLTLIRLQHQKRLKSQATQAMIQTMKMTKFLSSQQKSGDSKIKQIFTVLKHKIDRVKFRTRKIKSLVNNCNTEEMNRLFQLFKDSLFQSYRNQLELKEYIEKMNKRSNNQSKMSTIYLTNNMEQIISKKNQ